MKVTKALFCLVLLGLGAFAQADAVETGKAAPEVTAERKLASATSKCVRAVLKACQVECGTSKFGPCVKGAVNTKCAKSLKNKNLTEKKKFTGLINRAVKAKCPKWTPTTAPTFNQATCVVDDGGVCGGAGYSGCVNCKDGSSCVYQTALRSVCYVGGVPPKTTEPHNLGADDITTAWSFVQGLDTVLDKKVEKASKSRRLQSLDPSVEQDIRVQLSIALASPQGLNYTQKLMTENETFAAWNNGLAEQHQEAFCSLVSGSNATVSQEVKDCLCGVTSKPFVHCAALLENEVIAIQGATIHRRQLRGREQNRRKNLECGIGFSGIDPSNPLGGVLGVVANQFSDEPSEICVEASCGIPIPAFPVLEIDLGLEVCPTGIPSIDSTADEAIYETLAGTRVTLSAAVCLATTLDGVDEILELIGLSPCPLQIEGTIRPLLGLLEAELTAQISFIYAKGDILFLFDNEVRDKLGACGSTLECSNDDYKDCAMCKDDLVASVEVGIKFLFWSKTIVEASTAEVTGCAVEGAGDTCSSGIFTQDKCWEDGKLCGVGTSCEKCCSGHSYHYGLAMTACGQEKCWEDNRICGPGTTCKLCCNTAFNKGGWACGGSCQADGTVCALGSSCNTCCNGAEYWYSKGMTACGPEPCTADGKTCAAGTSCKNCCNGSEYWYSKAMTACGQEPCSVDGKTCALGSSCNNCCSPAKYWPSKAFTACGTPPCSADGTLCGLGSTCDNCCRSATYWSSKAMTACGSEPCLAAGKLCLRGSTCGKCCNGYKWKAGGYHCK